MQNLISTQKQTSYNDKIRALSATANRGKSNPIDYVTLLTGSPEDAAREEWRINSRIRRDFSSLESFVAFQKADAAGRVQICGRDSRPG